MVWCSIESDAFCTGFVFVKCAAYLYLLRGEKPKNTGNTWSTLWSAGPELHSDDVGAMTTLGHFVNRMNISYGGCSHFYVGNKYMIDDKFNLNLSFTLKDEEELKNGDSNQKKKEDGKEKRLVFCGCDYKAIEAQWYHTFYVELNDDLMEIGNAVITFLQDFCPKENITVIPIRGTPGHFGRNAQVRIEGIGSEQCPFKEMLEVMQSKQPQHLRFESFIEYKSIQLKGQYRQMYESLKSKMHKAPRDAVASKNKKRTLESEASSNGPKSEWTKWVGKEPPSKKRRTQ